MSCKEKKNNKIIDINKNKLICTINLDSLYLFSWQSYTLDSENKVYNWLQSEECMANFLNWDIQEGKRCGRQRQKDKIAVDEVQEDVFVICTKTDNNNLNYHYVWEKYVPK